MSRELLGPGLALGLALTGALMVHLLPPLPTLAPLSLLSPLGGPPPTRPPDAGQRTLGARYPPAGLPRMRTHDSCSCPLFARGRPGPADWKEEWPVGTMTVDTPDPGPSPLSCTYLPGEFVCRASLVGACLCFYPSTSRLTSWPQANLDEYAVGGDPSTGRYLRTLSEVRASGPDGETSHSRRSACGLVDKSPYGAVVNCSVHVLGEIRTRREVGRRVAVFFSSYHRP